MWFDKNIKGNRDVKFLECDYSLVQRCIKRGTQNGHRSVGVNFKSISYFWRVFLQLGS